MKRGIPVVIGVGLILFLAVRAFSDPVPMDRLQQLRKGMSKGEVREVLGEPAKIHESGQWTYQLLFVFGFVNIHWDADGAYIGEFDYERF